MTQKHYDYESGCLGKRRFESARLARCAANVVRASTGGRVAVYGCPFCGSFHVGHENSRVHRKRKNKKPPRVCQQIERGRW